MPKLYEEETKPLPIILGEWEELVGVIRAIEKSADSVSLVTYIASTGNLLKITLPSNSTAFTSHDLNSFTPGLKIGILRIPGNLCQFCIRIVQGEEL